MVMMGLFSTVLFGCTSDPSQYAPEQVINHALEETDAIESYYAEAETITTEKGEEAEKSILKEWRAEDGKVRIEMMNADGSEEAISVNDGTALTTYDPEQKTAFLIDDPEILSFNQPSPKEQAERLLEMQRDSHEIQGAGEATIAGRKTYHLTAKVKEKSTLFGDFDIWIDKNNWMILKTKVDTGDMQIETVYTKVDFNNNIPPETFSIDLPDDVEIQNMDELNKETTVTLDEAVENIGSFLSFPEDDGIQVSNSEMTELNGQEEARKEIEIDYNKDNLPLLSLSVFESTEPMKKLDSIGEETIMIRDQEGLYIEVEDFRSIFWQEDGKDYSVMIIDPNLTLEGFQDLAEGMEVVE